MGDGHLASPLSVWLFIFSDHFLHLLCVPLWQGQGRCPGVIAFALSARQCLKEVEAGRHLAPKMSLAVAWGPLRAWLALEAACLRGK